ncbi:MAG: CerR family C-terminal domain-containing protein [Sneathiella sp.]|nr:CerR family C-terminal domain-containing protein [Sneathiella sp.]
MPIKENSAAAKLLEIAGPLFADRSFDSVSTREIADRAGVNLSAISYHFGGKEGLYRAVFQKIVDDLSFVREFLHGFMEENLTQATGDAGQQRYMFQTIAHLIVGAVTNPQNPRWRMKLMMRELQEKGPCFDLVYEGHADIVHGEIARLVAVTTGHSEASADTRILSHAMIGMCLQFGLNEAFLSAQLGWEKFGPAEIKILQDKTTENIWALFGIAPLKEVE